MIIDCIADLHGHYPKLEGGDLLIVAGDLTRRDRPSEYDNFWLWLTKQDYKKKVVIAGNHDNFLQEKMDLYDKSFTYLCDSGTEFDHEEDETDDHRMHDSHERRFKIWGSPWTKSFPRMNPKCKAFTLDTEEELAEKWKLIPEDVDILVTHSPPFTCFDSCIDPNDGKTHSVGSPSLNKALERTKPRLHVFGHIHEHGGRQGVYKPNTIIVNASHVNERYKPVNKPIRVIL